MSKNGWKSLIAVFLVMTLVCGCASVKEDNTKEVVDMPVIQSTQESTEEVEDTDSSTKNRPALIPVMVKDEETQVIPKAATYSVDADLGNVDNLWQFYLEDEMKEKLIKNGFVVSGDSGNEFFEIYEENRYGMIPNFITVDSMMHTYHLYFGHLLKNMEKESLYESVLQLSKRMLDDSTEQYEKLKGSEWENAAKRNTAFFTVGTKLLDENTAVNKDVADIVEYELNHIDRSENIDISMINNDYEDYSQYEPRGYYEGDDKLSAYFKAMMWYGRIHFTQKDEDLDRSAILMTKALDEDQEAYSLWEAVYAVTSFFAGASDDIGVCEYAPLIREAYGDTSSIEGFIGNADAFLTMRTKEKNLRVPQINSIPIEDGEDNRIPGFRFMGQRFTIDASVMQKLVYSCVGENSEGAKRMLPDVLDVPAALGSDVALEILKKSGAADYEGYSENMDKLRKGFENADDSVWSASLYAGWLNTLRPLLEKKGEGYPVFMQNDEWAKKNLETFAGSFTELKHDTILYSKQVMAEMGGGLEVEPDDRGYVEPEPVVFERFASLAEMTAQGLKNYGMLSSKDEENLSRLSELAKQLLTISNKELSNETLSDEEYDLIRAYGGNIEHFWYDVMREYSDSDTVSSQEFPSALVVDIATDPNGEVLEAATGNPSRIIVLVNVDGKIKLASGSVYSFYQFTQPLNDRLTDSKWRVMMGIQADKNGEYHYDSSIRQPDWTDSYRYRYEWQ